MKLVNSSPPSSPFIVTIDGPSASGKSSVSRELARRLGWKWVSTGVFYRGLAEAAVREGLALDDIAGLVRLAGSPDIWQILMDEDRTRMFWRGQDLTGKIHGEESGARASQISRIGDVRTALLKNQRDCALGVTGLVAEGRDCGTVVFPQAILKIFLTASEQERAARRAREQQGSKIAEVQSQQRIRDHQDSSRAAAPLQIPPDARVLDSNDLDLSGVVEKIYQWVQAVLK